MAALVKQDDILNKLIAYLGDDVKPRKNGDTGPDHIHISSDGKCYCFEVISFTDGKQKGKNQSDFWKAFSQAISRLNYNPNWCKADFAVVALPMEFLRGWQQRVLVLGKDVWNRIGTAFPELQIWFVGDKKVFRYSWDDSFNIKI